ncbi:hypothetical protein BKI52_17610 [marine bacterium AO1-C]|nr:hypothetical protein BKI52_17610 [marine bacterium AO1-C]
MAFDINHTKATMAPKILTLYQKVAKVPDGIIRHPHEITLDYIEGFLQKSIKQGLALVATQEDQIVGEIHAYTPDIYAFQHILTDLTIVVDPHQQGQGIGRKLFEAFLATVKKEYTHILRIELYVRAHNHRNVKFYEGLGFQNEGKQVNKIFKTQHSFETPLHMAWFNPNYTGN